MSKFYFPYNTAGSESWPKSPNTPTAVSAGYYDMLGPGAYTSPPGTPGTLSHTFNSGDGDQYWGFTSPVGEPGVPWPPSVLNRLKVDINALGANCLIKRTDFFAVNADGDARAGGTATWQGANQTWNTTGVKQWDAYWVPNITESDYRVGVQLTMGNTSGTDQTITINVADADTWFATAWDLLATPDSLVNVSDFGTFTIASDSQQFSLDSVVNASDFGTLTMSAGQVNFSLDSVVNANAFGGFTFTPVIKPDSVESTNDFGNFNIWILNTLLMESAVNTSVFGNFSIFDATAPDGGGPGSQNGGFGSGFGFGF
jgi:hypothetical protein